MISVYDKTIKSRDNSARNFLKTEMTSLTSAWSSLEYDFGIKEGKMARKNMPKIIKTRPFSAIFRPFSVEI